MSIGCELIIEERQTDETAVAIRRRSMIPPSTGTVATINSVVAKRSSIEDLVLMHEDQIAEMVLIWPHFTQKSSFSPLLCIIMLCDSAIDITLLKVRERQLVDSCRMG